MGIKSIKISGLFLVFFITTFTSTIILVLIHSFGIYVNSLPLYSINIFKVYQLITHTFVHQSYEHLISNMIYLILFGLKVQEHISNKLFLLTFYSCAVVGSFSQILLTDNLNIVLVGSSDGVFGIMGFCFAISIIEKNYYILTVLLLILANTILNVIYIKSGGYIAHYAHLGGFLFGIYCFLFFKTHNWICQPQK